MEGGGEGGVRWLGADENRVVCSNERHKVTFLHRKSLLLGEEREVFSNFTAF